MMREGEAIGAVTVTREAPGEFSPRQIELLHTFADQAVIAIGNTRLFEAEQASKLQLQESLEYQTAMGEVLGVIARAPGDLQQVLDAVAESAARVCRATEVRVFRLEGNKLRRAAMVGRLRASDYGVSPDLPLSRGSVSGRAILDRRSIHVTDLAAEIESEYPDGAVLQKAIGHRTILATPLLRDGQAIGAIMMLRLEVAPFSEKQIKLLESFADQAVIAIENARLFEEVQTRTRELQLTIDRLTATNEVLRVISTSPTRTQPVFEAIVQSSKRLLNACYVTLTQVIGEELHLTTFTGTNRVGDDLVRASFPAPLRDVPLITELMSKRSAVVVTDTETDQRFLPWRDLARLRVYRSVLIAPLFRGSDIIGLLYFTRQEPGGFTTDETHLVRSFADQAIIAIENARLFEEVQTRTRELTESLEQQTATADVLKVISRSALDVQRVLDALVEAAARLCNADDAAILQVFGDRLRLVAHHGQIPTAGPVGQLAFPLVRELIGGRAIIDRRTIQVADMLAETNEYPVSWESGVQTGCRTSLAVPLVHAGEGIGVILVRRAEVRQFTERQIELVNTFADQAVIAIENTRLFEEVQSRTRELAKTVEDLEIASEHKNQF